MQSLLRRMKTHQQFAIVRTLRFAGEAQPLIALPHCIGKFSTQRLGTGRLCPPSPPLTSEYLPPRAPWCTHICITVQRRTPSPTDNGIRIAGCNCQRHIIGVLCLNCPENMERAGHMRFGGIEEQKLVTRVFGVYASVCMHASFKDIRGGLPPTQPGTPRR